MSIKHNDNGTRIRYGKCYSVLGPKNNIAALHVPAVE